MFFGTRGSLKEAKGFLQAIGRQETQGAVPGRPRRVLLSFKIKTMKEVYQALECPVIESVLQSFSASLLGRADAQPAAVVTAVPQAVGWGPF